MVEVIHPRAQDKLAYGNIICPRNEALMQAIGSRKMKHVYKHEQAYILTICATPNGCDLHFIVQAINAHHGRGQDPKRIVSHIWELTQRGIIERNTHDMGKYRVKAEVILKSKAILDDNAKKSGIIA